MGKKIIKNIAKILLLLGVTLFIYGLFGFQSFYYCGEGEGKTCSSLMLKLGKCYKCTDPAVYYYYSDEDRFLMAVGATLIIIGLSQIKRRSTE